MHVARFVRPLAVLLGAAAVPAALALTLPSDASAAPPQDVLTTLRADAAALAGAGDPAFAGVVLDPAHGVVRLYLTDPRRGPALLRAAARRPGFAAGRVVVARARFSRAALDRAAAAWLAGPHPAGVTALVVEDDGSGLVAQTATPAATTATGTAATAARPAAVRPGTAHAAPSATSATSAVPLVAPGGVPVRVEAGPARTAKAWNDVKWHDTAPFIGGDVLTSAGLHICTAGLPAVRVSDGRAVMVTAAHCFALGTRVYTGAGPTWTFGNGKVGDYVGTIVARNTQWDASVLLGSDTNGDESDTATWKPLVGAGYSYTGDIVCHDGARSASKGHPTPCGIKVTHDDILFPIGGHWARGVEGVDVHGWGSVNGDSGATVFAVLPGGRHEARGQVSSGGPDGTDDQARVDWVEAPDILRAFGLRLNPRT